MSLRKSPLPRLLLNNVSCMRNAQQILRHVNATVHDGGALVLMGTNGSGKTTFLRMLAGFSKPSAGQVLWNGHDITDSGVFHQYKLQLNWLSLKDAVKEKFTVLDNVQWFEVLEGKMGNSLPALELMGLGRLAKEKARMLSMGQRKRLQLARLLAIDRPIWLLDEPSVALDTDGVKLLEYIIAEHRKKGGIVIVATHLPIGIEDATYLRLPPRFPRRMTLNLAMELSTAPSVEPVKPTSLMSCCTPSVPLIARVYLELGNWNWALSPGLNDDSIQEILVAFRNATQCANKWAKAWHTWALFNTAVMSHYTVRGYASAASQFVVSAVTGYFHSIAYSANTKGVDDSLQDILRLLTLWFNHGATAEVQMALQKGFAHVNINTWLVVLPQIIARIHSNNHAVRELIQSFLVRIGQSHPQALMYPLLVACKSISNLRRAAAQEVVGKVRQHSGVVVDQAQLVSKELIRVAILWHEMWHEALEEASCLYFGEHNIEGMLKVLEPLHENMKCSRKEL